MTNNSSKPKNFEEANFYFNSDKSRKNKISGVVQKSRSYEEILDPDYKGDVLIIDDDENILRSLSRQINSELAFWLGTNYSPEQVKATDNSLEARQIIDNLPDYSVVLSDYEMGYHNHNGVEIAEITKDIRAKAKIGFIIYSGSFSFSYPHNEKQSLYENSIIDDEIIKPTKPSEVMNTIIRTINKKTHS
ncbi:response regulator [Candidatus Peregrinibacteria bacterium]|nr:response regulator [Candidatus Peregrinibacteria bacterium]